MESKIKALAFGMVIALALKAAAREAAPALTFPPELPDKQTLVTDESPEFLKPAATLREGVEIAKTPPRIELLYYPGQDYPGKPWSAWGDSIVANGKYYASIGDHMAIGAKGDTAHTGNAIVYEYDPAAKALRRIVETQKVLAVPEGHYAPGKIHGRLDMGKDGWLYFSTHRGSARATTDQYFYEGDWILCHNPATGATEIVAHGPVPKHCIPCSVLDPDRLIFYGGTASGAGAEDSDIRFFAYDVTARKLLYSGPDGPARYMLFARSTGKIYYVPGKEMTGALVRFDPAKPGPPTKIAAQVGCRAATAETPGGIIYTVSNGARETDAPLWSFNTKTEEAVQLTSAAVGSRAYIASLDADPTGHYLYYIPGAHGGSEADGSPVVQFNTATGKKKVIAFLNPYYKIKYGFTLTGTFSSALDEKGETLYVTWNSNRGTKAWDSCVLTVIHIPASERKE